MREYSLSVRAHHCIRGLLCAGLAMLAFVANADSLVDTDEFEIPQDVYNARQVSSDRGISIIEFSGDYNKNLSNGSPNAAARAVVAREFYAHNPDNYDFLVVFTDFEFETGEAEAFHLGVSNNVEGIGLPIYSNAPLFGSDEALKGYIDMAAVSRYERNSLVTGRNSVKGTFDSALKTLAHETLHQWAAHTEIEDLQGRDDGHWNFFLDSDASLEYGHEWRDNEDGTFTAESARSSFSKLDLYLMGMLGSEEVPDMFVIQPSTNEYSKEDLPTPGITVSGTRTNYSIENFIDVHGERVPSVSESEKVVRYGFIFLTAVGETVDPSKVQQIESFQREYEDRFSILTAGRAIAQVYPTTEIVGQSGAFEIVESSGDLSADGANILQGIEWLKTQRLAGGQWQDKTSTILRDTTTALGTLSIFDNAYFPDSDLRNWLIENSANNIDSLSRVLSLVPDLSGLNQKLIESQQLDGGWGLNGNFRSSVQDTALAVCALAMSSSALNSNGINRALTYFYSNQNADGGWGYVEGSKSSVGVTSQVLKAYACANENTPSTEDAITWLSQQVHQDGGFGDSSSTVHETAEVILSLLANEAIDQINFELAANYISGLQSVDGDWSGSVYTTALAVNAVQSARFPNLKVDSIQSEPEILSDGDFVKIIAIIHNDSGDLAEESIARFYQGAPDEGGIEFGMVNVPQLPPFSSVTVAAYWNSFDQQGIKNLYVVADADNRILERTETDNQLQYPVSVLPPVEGVELLVNHNEFVVEPNSITTLPTQLAFTAILRNIGDTSAEEVRVELWAGDSDLSGVQVGFADVSIDTRSSNSVSFSAQHNSPNKTIYYLLLDSDNKFEEINERNNRAEREIAIVDGIDLEILPSDIQFERQPLLVNQVNNFSVTVRNNGTVTTPNTEVLFKIVNTEGEEELQSVDIVVEPGEEKLLNQSWLATFSGTSTVVVDIDPNNLVAEISESNNHLEQSFEASLSEGNNLSVHFSDLQFNPEIGLEGMGATINVNVRNSGTTEVMASTISFYDGNPVNGAPLIGSSSVTGLGSGASSLVSIVWPSIPTDGSRFIYVVVDPENILSELEEGDNVAFKKFEVISLPDISISSESIQSNPKFPKINENIEFSVSVTNQGKQDVDSVTIEAYLGNDESGQLLESASISVAGASSVEWIFSSSFDSFGSNAIYVSVDGDNRVVESDELNNSAKKNFQIQDGNFYISELYFSPDGNRVKDTVEYFFNLDVAQQTEVLVLNKYDQVVRSFRFSDQNTQSNSVVWDGRNDAEGVVADGTYRFVIEAASGELLGESPIVVDTNRSSLSESIDTKYGVSRNLSCRIGLVDKIFDNAVTSGRNYLRDKPDTQNLIYGPNDQYIYFTTYFEPYQDADGNTVRVDENTIYPSGIYRALNDGSEVIQLASNDRLPIDGITSLNISDDGNKLLVQEFSVPNQSIVNLWTLDNDGQDLRLFTVNATAERLLENISFTSGGEIIYRDGSRVMRLNDEPGAVPNMIFDASSLLNNLESGSGLIESIEVNSAGTHILLKLVDSLLHRDKARVSFDLLRKSLNYQMSVIEIATGIDITISRKVNTHRWNHSRTAFAVAEGDESQIRIVSGEGLPLKVLDLSGLRAKQFNDLEKQAFVSYFDFRTGKSDVLDSLSGRIDEIVWNPDQSELAIVVQDNVATGVVSDGCGGGISPVLGKIVDPSSSYLDYFISSAQAASSMELDCRNLSSELGSLFDRYQSIDGIYVVRIADTSIEQVARLASFEASSLGGDLPQTKSTFNTENKNAANQNNFEIAVKTETLGFNSFNFPITQDGLPYIEWTGFPWLRAYELESLRSLRWMNGGRELLITNGDASKNYEIYSDNSTNNRFDREEFEVSDLALNNTILLNLDFPKEETRQVFQNRDLLSFESVRTKRGIYPTNTGKFLSFFSDDVEDKCVRNSQEDGYRQFQSLLNLTADLRVKKSPEIDGFILEGSAVDKHFDYYQLEFSDVASPETWNLISPPSDAEVIDNRFTNWVPPYIGRFYLRLSVFDLAGNVRREISQVSNAEKPSISGVYLSEANFSPNGDDVKDRTILVFRVLENVNIQVEIYNEQDVLVRTISDSFDLIGAEESIEWNGRDDLGQVVADGKYRFSVQRYEYFTNVDNTPPVISEVIPPIFSPPQNQPAPNLRKCRYAEAFLIGDEREIPKLSSCRVSVDLSGVASVEEAALETFIFQMRPRGGSDWQDISNQDDLSLGSQQGVTELSFSPSIDLWRESEFRYRATDLAGNRSLQSLENIKSDKVHILGFAQIDEVYDANSFGYANNSGFGMAPEYRASWGGAPPPGESFSIYFQHSASEPVQFYELLYRNASDGDSEFASFTITPAVTNGRMNAIPNALEVPDLGAGEPEGFKFDIDTAILESTQNSDIEMKLRLRLPSGLIIDSDTIIVSQNAQLYTMPSFNCLPTLGCVPLISPKNRLAPSVGVDFGTNLSQSQVDRMVLFVRSIASSSTENIDVRYDTEELLRVTRSTVLANGSVSEQIVTIGDGVLVRDDLDPILMDGRDQSERIYRVVDSSLGLIDECGYDYAISTYMFHLDSLVPKKTSFTHFAECEKIIVDVDPIPTEQCNAQATDLVAVHFKVESSAESVEQITTTPLYIQIGLPSENPEQPVLLQSLIHAQNFPELNDLYSFEFDTSDFAPGELTLRAFVKFEDGRDIFTDFVVPISHQAPIINITYPLDGQKICATNYIDPKDETKIVRGVELQGQISSETHDIRVGISGSGVDDGDYAIAYTGSKSLIDNSETNLQGQVITETSLNDQILTERLIRVADNAVIGPERILQNLATKEWAMSGVLAIPKFLDSGEVDLSFMAHNWSGANVCQDLTFRVDADIEGLNVNLTGTNRISSEISGKTVSYISPNSDQQFDAAEFTVGAAESVSVSMQVFSVDENGDDAELVASPYFNVNVTSGQGEFDWAGADDNGENLSDAVYNVNLRVMDGCGNIEESKHPVGIDTTAPELHISYPNDLDNVALQIRVIGEVSDENPDSYQLSVSNDGIAFRLVERGTGNIKGLLGEWNSFGFSGPQIFRLDAKDKLGNSASSDHVFNLPDRISLISSLSTTEYFVSPNSDGRKDRLTIRASLEVSALTTLKILDAQGNLIKELVDQIPFPQGYTSVEWNGLSSQEVVVPDGIYFVEMTVGAIGNIQTESVSFEVDNELPTIDLFQLQEGYIRLAGQNQITGEISDINFTDYQLSIVSPADSISENRIEQPLQIAFSNEQAAGLVALIPENLFDFEAEYIVSLLARDAAGNRATMESRAVIDLTPPRIQIVAPSGGQALNIGASPVVIAGSVKDEFLYKYFVYLTSEQSPDTRLLVEISDAAAEYSISNLEIDGLEDGKYVIDVEAVDLGGLTSKESVEIVVDNQAPETQITQPARGAFVSTIASILGTANDEYFEQYSLAIADGHIESQADFSNLITSSKRVVASGLHNWSVLPSDGKYTLQLVASDSAGNFSKVLHPFSVDTLPPEAPKLLSVNLGDADDEVLVKWSANSEPDLAGYVIYQNGLRVNTELIPDLEIIQNGLAEGSYKYEVTAVDEAGLESLPSNSKSIIVDVTPPSVEIASPVNGALVNELVNVLGTAHSEDDFNLYRVYIGVSEDALTLIQESNLPVVSDLLVQWETLTANDNSEYLIRLEAEDIRGNQSSTQIQVVVDNLATGAPANLIAEIESQNSARLNWEFNSSDDDLFGFLLYRNGTLVTATEPVIGDLRPYALRDTTYLDAALVDGEHQYQVYALDLAGNISFPSNFASVSLDNRAPHMEITNIEDGQGFDGELFIVAESPDIDIAEVLFQYRANGEANWIDIAIDQTFPYEYLWVSADLAYGLYEIRAVATDQGAKTDSSPEIKAVEKRDVVAPDNVKNISLQVVNNQGTLTWGQNLEDDLAGYYVYRADCETCDYLKLSESLVTDLQIQDDVPFEQVLFYQVRAVDSTGNESAASTIAIGIYTDTLIRPAEFITRQDTTVLTIGLSNPNTQFEQATLNVAGPSGTQSNTQLQGNAGAGIDVDVPVLLNGIGVHRYQATAESISEKFVASTSIETTIVSTGTPSVPTGLIAPFDSANNSFALSWAENIPSEQIVAYKVYRDDLGVEEDQLIQDGTATSNLGLGIENALPSSPYSSFWSVAGVAGVNFQQTWDENRLVNSVQLDWTSSTYSPTDFDIYAQIEGEMIQVANYAQGRRRIQIVELPIAIPTNAIEIRVKEWSNADLGGRLNRMQVVGDTLFDTTTSYQDPADGQVHIYQIQAINRFGGVSDISDPIAGSFVDNPPPISVVLDGYGDLDTAFLTWTSSPEAGTYEVYQDGQLVKTSNNLEAEIPNLTNAVYQFHVVAVSSAGSRSEDSNIVDIVINQALLTAPIGLQAVVNAELRRIELSWQSIQNEQPFGYRVYRSEQSSSGYSIIQESSETSFLDYSIESQAEYFYVIVALDSFENESAYSNEAQAILQLVEAYRTPELLLPTDSNTPYVTTEATTNIGGVASPNSDVYLLADNEVLGPATVSTSKSKLVEFPMPSGGGRVIDTLFLGGQSPLILWDSTAESAIQLLEYRNEKWRNLDIDGVIASSSELEELYLTAQSNVIIKPRFFGDTYHYDRSTGDVVTLRFINLPDGVSIDSIFSYNTDLGIMLARGFVPTLGFGLYKFNLDTLIPSVLPDFFEYRISPNGRYLAYTPALVGPSTDVVILDLLSNESVSTELAGVNRNSVFDLEQSWSPNSKRLALRADYGNGNAGLIEYDFGLGNLHVLEEFLPGDGVSRRSLLQAIWSGNSKLIYTSVDSNDGQVLLREFSGLSKESKTLEAWSDELLLTSELLGGISGQISLSSGLPENKIFSQYTLAGHFVFEDIDLAQGDNRFTAVTLDSQENISQPAEVISVVYSATPLPDYQTEIEVNPTFPILGRDNSLIVEIFNMGAVTAVQTTFTLKVLGPDGAVLTLANQLIDSLEPNSSIKVSFPWRPIVSGAHVVMSEVDSPSLVVEQREDNNTRIVNVNVLESDAPLLELSLSPSTSENIVFSANEALSGIVRVSNPSEVFAGLLRIEIVDAQGNLVESLKTVAVDHLGFADEISVAYQWNTGVTVSGNYYVNARLSDLESSLVTRKKADFEIVDELQMSLGVTTNQYSYAAREIANFTTTIWNNSIATILDTATLELVVKSPSGEDVFRQQKKISEVFGGSRVALNFTWDVGLSVSGMYTAEAVLLKNDQVLTQAQAIFEVRETRVKVAGKIAIIDSELIPNQPLVFNSELVNIGNSVLRDVHVIYTISSGAGALDSSSDLFELLDLEQSLSKSNSMDISALTVGRYSIVMSMVLNAGTNSENLITLDEESFQVIENQPPILEIVRPSEGQVINSTKVSAMFTAQDSYGVRTAEILLPEEQNGAGVSWAEVVGNELQANNYHVSLDRVPEGSHQLSARATDTNNNQSNAITRNFIVDNTPPQIRVDNIIQGQVFDAAIVPNIIVQDPNLERWSATLNRQNWPIGSEIRTSGEFKLIATAYDSAGNVNTYTTDFEIRVTNPPQRELIALDDQLMLRRGVWGTVSVLENDRYEDLDALDIEVLESPVNGSLVEASKGVFNYFPRLTYVGIDHFKYKITDTVSGKSSDAIVNVDVSPTASCSLVPNHQTDSTAPVNLDGWAVSIGTIGAEPKYRINIKEISKLSVFEDGGEPKVSFPECSLSYTPKPNTRAKVVVRYEVVDVRTNGTRYTSAAREFLIQIDTLNSTNKVLVPLLQLLLLEEEI